MWAFDHRLRILEHLLSRHDQKGMALIHIYECPDCLHRLSFDCMLELQPRLLGATQFGSQLQRMSARTRYSL
jgi:hypothetical protein